MVEKKKIREKSRHTGITGSELASILNAKSCMSKEESRDAIFKHIAFGSKKVC